jgi:hypothetical protein
MTIRRDLLGRGREGLHRVWITIFRISIRRNIT